MGVNQELADQLSRLEGGGCDAWELAGHCDALM
eukprot:COSAG01_NODE_1724_length_9382_cov_6.435743_9_plen_32_part_01